MSYEEIRVITVVYLSVFIPLIIYIRNRFKLPKWVPTFYLIAFGLPATPQLIHFFQQRFGPRTPYLSSPISSSNLCAC